MSGIFLSAILFGEGLLTGLTLTIMLGPVTMIILRYGIQINRVGGVWAAAGTWFSDLLFIAGTFWTTASLAAWIERPSVQQSIYLAGGCGLLLIGIFMMRVKRHLQLTGDFPGGGTYARAFLSGFFVNSISPATLFFWVGAAVFLRMQDENPLWYYLGVMLSLAMGDFFKAWMAPWLTKWIKDKYIYWVQVVAGIIIGLTGLYLIAYSFFE